MKKNLAFFISIIMVIACLFVGCLPTGNPTVDIEKPEELNDANITQQTAEEVTSLYFYGMRPEEDSWAEMVNKTIELHPELNVEVIEIDWQNIDKIFKASIASGTAPDIMAYWPMLAKPYIDSEQVLDLTPYLEENNNEWKDEFFPELLEFGNFEGKYYAIPYQSTFPTMFINVDMFQKAGVDVPENWTFDEFLAACEKIKESTGKPPFTIPKHVSSWFVRLGAAGLALEDNKLEEYTNGEMDLTINYFPQVMEKTKQLYDKQLWYPGYGALNTTADESKAAFLSGEAAICAETNLAYGGLIADAKFEIKAVTWPRFGSKPVIVGGTDGFMIPASAQNVEGAIAFLKTFLSPEIQQIRADDNYPVAIKGVTAIDETVNSILDQTKYLISEDILNVSLRLSEYMNGDFMTDYILNDPDFALKKAEGIRADTLH